MSRQQRDSNSEAYNRLCVVLAHECLPTRNAERHRDTLAGD